MQTNAEITKKIRTRKLPKVTLKIYIALKSVGCNHASSLGYFNLRRTQFSLVACKSQCRTQEGMM